MTGRDEVTLTLEAMTARAARLYKEQGVRDPQVAMGMALLTCEVFRRDPGLYAVLYAALLPAIQGDVPVAQAAGEAGEREPVTLTLETAIRHGQVLYGASGATEPRMAQGMALLTCSLFAASDYLGVMLAIRKGTPPGEVAAAMRKPERVTMTLEDAIRRVRSGSSQIAGNDEKLEGMALAVCYLFRVPCYSGDPQPEVIRKAIAGTLTVEEAMGQLAGEA